MRLSRTHRLVLIAALAQASCVNVFYRHETRFEPPQRGALAELAPDRSDLGDCLARLGAPLWVWEDRGAGAALAYGWLESGDWNVSVNLPVSNDASASLTWRQIDARMRGVVLFFDPDWTLRAVRKGYLRDLTARLRGRRPSFEVAP
jgi:hypothetical protein